jgi:hypothetical protein
MTAPTEQWTVRDLRRRWKPVKEQLQALRSDHPTAIRVHRCCSWMQRVEEQQTKLDDTALVYRWIALNSLYGRWDEERREPAGDRKTLAEFADRILELDKSNHLTSALVQHKRLVMSIMEDEYLARHYWEDPTIERARRTKKAVFDARRCYVEKRYPPILWRLLDRIYLLRCQLMHGAATAGGALNRTSVRRCNLMLGHLLPATLLVVIDHGGDVDWGPLCYPPHTNNTLDRG